MAFAYALATVAGVSAGAQTLTGRIVSNATKRPVASAHVVLRTDSAEVATASTDRDGVFYAAATRVGSYHLWITDAGGATYDAGLVTLVADEDVQREFRLEHEPVRYEFDVERPAAALPSGVAPRYPDAMLRCNREGMVAAQFVVLVDGRVDMRSFRALHSPDPAFTASVEVYLRMARYRPAEIAHQAVPQLVHQAFTFTLPGGVAAGGCDYGR